MKPSFRAGVGFGLTSGVITTLGTILGLYSTTNSKLAIIGGILSIAIADAFSDSLGIHVSQEAEDHHPEKEVWESTVSTFAGKLIIALTFVIPALFLSIKLAVIASIIWGFFLLTVFNFYLAKSVNKNYCKIITEHLIITVFVITTTYFVGLFIRNFFLK